MFWSVVKDSDSIRGPTGICCDFGVGSKSDEIRCSLPTNFGQVQCRGQSAVHVTSGRLASYVLRLRVLPLTPESDGKIVDGQHRVWMLCPEHARFRFEHRAMHLLGLCVLSLLRDGGSKIASGPQRVGVLSP